MRQFQRPPLRLSSRERHGDRRFLLRCRREPRAKAGIWLITIEADGGDLKNARLTGAEEEPAVRDENCAQVDGIHDGVGSGEGLGFRGRRVNWASDELGWLAPRALPSGEDQLIREIVELDR